MDESVPTEYDTASISETELEKEPSVIAGEIIETEEEPSVIAGEIIETEEDAEVPPEELLFPASVEQKLREVRDRMESSQQSCPDDTIISMLMQLYEHIINVEKKTDHLAGEFKGKLKYDAHKDKIIDNLHQELQAYKDDLLKKYLKNFVTDIIQVIDNIRKLTSHYSSLPISERDPEKLLDIMDNIPADFEDVLYRQGVWAFTCDGNIFDPKRQRVLNKKITSDPSEDKKVAESLRPGYEWDGQVIRPEMVAVYVYQADAETEMRKSDE